MCIGSFYLAAKLINKSPTSRSALNTGPLSASSRIKMCKYTYSTTYCGCEYYIHYDSVEFCEHRTFSGYSVDGWSSDMCDNKVVICEGIGDYYCDECSEDHTLEYDLDE